MQKRARPLYCVRVHDSWPCLLTGPSWCLACDEPLLIQAYATDPFPGVPFSSWWQLFYFPVGKILSRSVPELQKYIAMLLKPVAVHRGFLKGTLHWILL